MAGFEEFINLLKEANSSKLSSSGSLNFILDKINDAVKVEKAAQKSEDPIPKAKTVASKKAKASDKPEVEKGLTTNEQKRAASNDVIMKHSLDNKAAEDQVSYDISNFNFETTTDRMIQGLIYSEILDKPISKRRGGRRQRRNW
jgi:hypothetical protein